MTDDGDFDYLFLENNLRKYKNYNTLKIGAFQAGSNITGTIFDVDRIAIMCHKAGALAVFDYAATSPYVDINVTGITDDCFPKPKIEDQNLAYLDAIILSPHKLVGGPGSSGVLIAKKEVMTSSKPHRLGGGIVFFVNEMEHEFLSDKQEREESGTPGII